MRGAHVLARWGRHKSYSAEASAAAYCASCSGCPATTCSSTASTPSPSAACQFQPCASGIRTWLREIEGQARQHRCDRVARLAGRQPRPLLRHELLAAAADARRVVQQVLQLHARQTAFARPQRRGSCFLRDAGKPGLPARRPETQPSAHEISFSKIIKLSLFRADHARAARDTRRASAISSAAAPDHVSRRRQSCARAMFDSRCAVRVGPRRLRHVECARVECGWNIFTARACSCPPRCCCLPRPVRGRTCLKRCL